VSKASYPTRNTLETTSAVSLSGIKVPKLIFVFAKYPLLIYKYPSEVRIAGLVTSV